MRVARPGSRVECSWHRIHHEEDLMTDAALFIGWGATASGRERKAVDLFGESLRFLTNLVVEGRVASVEPFFLEPHGGDLEGFFVVRGEQEELNRIRTSDEFQRLAVKAQVLVQNFGVVGAVTGERLNKHMAWFADAARQADTDERP
jgi:hypothetical protein